MKKLLAIFLCLLMVISLVGCKDTDSDPEIESNQASTKEKTTEEISTEEDSAKETEEVSKEEELPYSFISKQERLTWKEKIINSLSASNCYDYIDFGFIGAALMDMNFDNTPELIVAYSGGTMGNVCLNVFDIESGEELCILGDTPHYGDWDEFYFCVCRDNQGNYHIVNQGALRVGLTHYMITSVLNDQFKLNALFEELVTADDNAVNTVYYCEGKDISKAEYETQRNQFTKGYITETEVKIIRWDSLNADNKSEAFSQMADALINSKQEFIKYDID